MLERTTRQDHCLVTLTDTLYLPGTRRLIASVIRQNGTLPIIVLSDDPVALKDPFLAETCERLIPIDPSRYADIRPYKKRHSKRHARTFYKFEAFANYGYQRNIFLDSDILCLRPTPKLFDAGSSPLMAARDMGSRKTRAYKGSTDEINSGVLVIDQSIQGTVTLENLHQTARENPGRGGYNAGDQGIINKWIREVNIEIDFLPSEYNLIKKDYEDLSELDTCRLLHYCDRKPWIPAKESDSSPQALVKIWEDTFEESF